MMNQYVRPVFFWLMTSVFLTIPMWSRAVEPEGAIAFKNGDKVAFLGDSITQAGGDKLTGYIRLLQSALRNEGIEIHVVRAGISGQKSDQMLARLQKDVLVHQPDWLALSCGVNDVWKGPNGIPLEQYRTNMTMIVEQAKQAGVRVIILTATMIREDPDNPENITLADYNDFLRELAREKECLLADLNADMQVLVKEHRTSLGGQPYYDILTSDGVHMNVAGDSMMAVGILRAIGMKPELIQAAVQSWAGVPAQLDKRFPVTYTEQLYVETMPPQERQVFLSKVNQHGGSVVPRMLQDKPDLKLPALLRDITGSPGLREPGFGGFTYRLPDFKEGTRVLFQGDSITDMGRSRDPNTTDQNHILGHSYVFVVAGRLGMDMRGRQLHFINRGFTGNGAAELKARWSPDAIDVQPDVLSILVGVNNVMLNKDLETFEADYRQLLDASRKANPDLKIVLLDPFTLKAGQLAANEGRWNHMRGGIDSLLPIVARLAKDYDAVHIKTQEIFDQASALTSPGDWLWDGFHPTARGHELIARHWLEEVGARWPLVSP